MAWNICFICLNNFEEDPGRKIKRKKEMGRTPPWNAKHLLKYILQTGKLQSPNFFNYDQLLQDILLLLKSSGSQVLCEDCADSSRRVSNLQTELEVIQMKMIDIVKTVRENVISKMKHLQNELKITNMNILEFEKLVDQSTNFKSTDADGRNNIGILYAFHSAIFKSANEAVNTNIPYVYLERLTSSKHPSSTNIICKVEPFPELSDYDDDSASADCHFSVGETGHNGVDANHLPGLINDIKQENCMDQNETEPAATNSANSSSSLTSSRSNKIRSNSVSKVKGKVTRNGIKIRKGKKSHSESNSPKRKAKQPMNKKTKTTRSVRDIYSACKLCPYKTALIYRYEHHLRGHEQTGIVNHTCPHADCARQFSEQQSFQFHMRSHRGFNKLTCDICSKLIGPFFIVEHFREEHKIDKIFQCSCCSFCSGTRESFLRHVRYHGMAALVCDICSKRFRNRRKMLAHLHDVHQVLEKIKCDVPGCDKEFFEPGRLHVHKAMIHSKPFLCSECNAHFPTLKRLQDHETQKHSGEKPKPHSCAQCSESFPDKASLSGHMIRAHGAAKLKCPYCPKEYATQGAFTSHVNLHEGNVFRCDKCDKEFGYLAQLQRHQLSHSTTREFVCDECGKAFAYSRLLKTHQKRHNGERKYKCSYCPKAFLDRKNVVSHERIHTGEKPYVCEACGKGFNQQGLLKQHMKSRHKELTANV